MKSKNKYHFDVKNCRYCPGVLNEDGSVTYGDTVKPIYGLMSMDLGAEGDTAKTRADGHDYIIIVSNNGYSGTLNFVMVPDEFKVDCLAEKVDEKTGMQYEDADASPAPFALMGEFKGDKEGIRWIFYNCTASRPKVAGDNKDNQKEPDAEELSVTVSPMLAVINGEEINIVRGGITKSMNADTYNAWFKQVCIPGMNMAGAEGAGAEGTEIENEEAVGI